MEIVAGALPSLLPKLAELLAGEYSLQKEVKGGIIFLRAELESMQGALQKISQTPADKLDDQDKIWARNVREMSYDIEDTIDSYMVRCKGKEMGEQHGLKEAIDRTLKWFRQPKIRRKIAKEVREIKIRVEEVANRRDRYKINSCDVAKPVSIDPRLFAQYEKVTELVGIDEAREEIIQILMDGNEGSKQQDKIVSIVGFGGLGKTTLANVVYEKLRAQFVCSAFVSVSQTPDLQKFLKEMFYQVAKQSNKSTDIIGELREFLQDKRYFIVIDDIWDISVWKMIKCALPDNNVGSKIITTTRIFDVGERAGGVYKLNPLSLDNSQKLLYRRIFGSNEDKDNNEDTGKCPDEELAEVSNKILKKCAGVPLAIITIASLLANKGRNIMDWYQVYKSIGTGLENSMDVVNMRKILLLSYYDLPSHLKTCLLYLSVFPEDFEIEKDHLIWMWIAEGFIHCKGQGKSLLEHGESYFNELANRSLIQPVYHEKLDGPEYCRVHDMVLELIHFLSNEENFITILNENMDHSSPTNTTRRLSLQNSKADHAELQANISKDKIRSVVVFLRGQHPLLDLGGFRVLRVLALDFCFFPRDHSLKYLGKLIHLRYLGLGTFIGQLPDEDIRNLRFLLALDIRNTRTRINNFPSAVFQLKSLRCLHIQCYLGVPNGISNLTCLEVLTLMWICHSTTIIELGHLTELRKLRIVLDKGCTDGLEKSMAESIAECLNKLKKIQSVDIFGTLSVGIFNNGRLDSWRAPPNLRKIKLDCCWLSARPDWMNTSHVRHLSFLSINVVELHQGDLRIIGSLPALRYLSLCVRRGLNIIISTSSFPSLVQCRLLNFIPPAVFRQGAMPRLTELEFTFAVRKTREIVGSIGGCELGLGNLTSLQYVKVDFADECDSREDREEAMVVVSREAEVHPNRPTLKRRPWE